MYFRSNKESSEQITQRLEKLVKEKHPEYNGVPAMSSDTALQELTRYLLGDDWYCVDPIHSHQVNFVIVKEIEERYRRKYWWYEGPAQGFYKIFEKLYKIAYKLKNIFKLK